jgi:hypothetical protein
LSAAATRIATTQPTLSRHIQALQHIVFMRVDVGDVVRMNFYVPQSHFRLARQAN